MTRASTLPMAMAMATAVAVAVAVGALVMVGAPVVPTSIPTTCPSSNQFQTEDRMTTENSDQTPEALTTDAAVAPAGEATPAPEAAAAEAPAREPSAETPTATAAVTPAAPAAAPEPSTAAAAPATVAPPAPVATAPAVPAAPLPPGAAPSAPAPPSASTGPSDGIPRVIERTRRRRGRRKAPIFPPKEVLTIDYKDVDKLRRLISERGKIDPRRKTGLIAKDQRKLTRAIKRARHLALLPYTAEHMRQTSQFRQSMRAARVEPRDTAPAEGGGGGPTEGMEAPESDAPTTGLAAEATASTTEAAARGEETAPEPEVSTESEAPVEPSPESTDEASSEEPEAPAAADAPTAEAEAGTEE